jgi:hypothetical protein
VLAVQSTWYGSGKFRKGAARPPAVASKLAARTPPIDAATVLRKTQLKSVSADGSGFALLPSEGGLLVATSPKALGAYAPRLDLINLLG